MSAIRALRPEPNTAAQSLREVRRGVAEAADAQVLQVVRMVDALSERGATDAVLDPVRPRLRAIQPARPLRFARLLFMPLDPLIVAPKDWRPGTPFLPRTALLVLARAARAIMSASGQQACVDQIDRLIEGARTDQAALVRQAGGMLWPHAASALCTLGAGPPAAVLEACAKEWQAEGLVRAELQPVAAALSPILTQALALHDHDHSGVPLADEALLDMLTATEPAGVRACGMMLSLLVIRVPHAAPALLGAAQKLPSLRPLAEAAANAALAWVEADTADQSRAVCDAASVELIRQTALLEALTAQPGSIAARGRVAEIRHHLLDGCLARFETSLRDQVVGSLAQMPGDPAARDAALDMLEATARTLRRFEVEARRLGGTQKFDVLVQTAGDAVRLAEGLSDMDRARLIEIMAGPEAAARCLSG